MRNRYTRKDLWWNWCTRYRLTFASRLRGYPARAAGALRAFPEATLGRLRACKAHIQRGLIVEVELRAIDPFRLFHGQQIETSVARIMCLSTALGQQGLLFRQS